MMWNLKHIWHFRSFLLLCVVASNLVQITKSQTTTIIVATSPFHTTTTTVTPTIGQSVELQCSGDGVGKRWYTTGSVVEATQNEISTSSGNTRILAFSSFTPSHAGTYTCLVSSVGDTQTKTTYPVVLVNPSAINTIRVGRTDDPTTPITITPTLSQPVKLECDGPDVGKNWFTSGTAVTDTPGYLSNIPSTYVRTITISSFSTSHAKGYTCTVNSNPVSTYPVTLETPPPVPEITPPSQVQGVMLTGSGTSLNVSWTAVTGTDPKYAIGYVVGYSTDSGTETDPPSDAMKISGITATSTTLTGLQSGTTYYVWVAAEILGAGVQGPYSMRMQNSVPSKVTGVTVSPMVTSNQPSLRVTWSAPSSERTIQHYQVDYRVGTSSSWSRWSPNPTSTSVTLTSLQRGTTYPVRVRAVSDVGNGEWSNTVSETTYDVPGAPTNLMISPPSESCDQLMVTWTAPSNTGGLPVKYKVYRDSDEVQSMITTTTWNGLTANTQYTVRVVAFNDLGDGGEVTGTGNTKPQAPSISSLSASSSTQLIITLTAPARSSSLTYKCTISTTVNGSSPKTVTDTVLQFTVDGLSPYVTYTVECTSSNGVDSCDSNMDTIRMPSAKPGGPPLNLRAEPSSKSAILRWDPPAEKDQNGVITGYLIKYQLSNDSSNQMRRTVGAVNRSSLDNLMTGVTYSFTVAAINSNGTGPDATMVIFTTIPDIQNLRVSEVTSSMINVTWDAPPDGYTVDAPYAEATDSSTEGKPIRDPSEVASSTWHRFGNCNSFREYRVFVRLSETGGNEGSYSIITARTLGKPPTGQPNNFSSIPNITFITVQWSAPDLWERNGIITNYIIEWGETGSLTTLNYSVPNPTFNTTDDQRYTFRDLKPITEYTFNIAAVNINGTGPVLNGMSTTLEEVPGPVKNLMKTASTDTSVTISWDPPEPSDGYTSVTYTINHGVLNTTGQAMTTENNETGINTLKPGIPYYVTVTAGTTGGNGKEKDLIFFTNEKVPDKSVDASTIETVWSGNSLTISWEPLTLHEARGFPVYYIYLNDSSGPVKREIEPTANTTESSIVINGLDSSQTNMIAIGVVTGGGNLRGPVSGSVPISSVSPSSSPGPDNPGTIIAIVVVIVVLVLLALAIVIIIVIFVRRRKKEKKSDYYAPSHKEASPVAKPKSDNYLAAPKTNLTDSDDFGSAVDIQKKIDITNGAVDEPLYANLSKAISKSQFAAHVREMRMERDSGFEKEYNTIQNDPKGKETIAKAHRTKNRYLNIHTFDHSRVILSAPDENGSDYINASYIDGYKRKNAYIASQGPTPNSISDFWQMIWDHRPPVLVMLTQPEEKGRKKCERYWIDDAEQVFEPGRGFSILVRSYHFFADYEVREILVKKSEANSKPFTLKHFLYTGWPDHGVPQHPSSLVRFAKQVRKAYHNSQSPLIVHCSAGVGRTGTFITIDTMLLRLKERTDLNIYEFVTQCRTKRTFMVQNQEQYVFIHDALNDYLTCGETAVPAHELRRKITDLEASVQDKKMTGFQSEFNTLNSVSKSVCKEDSQYSMKSPVARKNRYQDKFPYSLNHLHISGRSAENGNDYVNASFVNSYSSARAFIAAQSPLMHTRDDLWELVWQFKTSVIVLLCDFKENKRETCVQFWPSGKIRTAEYSFLKVDLMYTEDNQGYTTYTLNVSDKRKPETKPLELTLFHSSDWRADGAVQITPLMKMMGDVEKKQCGSEKPVIAMCDDGMGRTGVFITAMSEIERVKIEGEVDIFQTVKSMRVQRPNMVSTVEQYKLCYEMLQAYLDSFDTYANFKVV